MANNQEELSPQDKLALLARRYEIHRDAYNKYLRAASANSADHARYMDAAKAEKANMDILEPLIEEAKKKIDIS
jgi:hypothetical protein